MNERRLKILEMLNQAGSLEVGALADALGVSAVTVRKDLALLEEQGLLRRVHGSAVRVSPDDIGYRMTFDYETKKRIAHRAAQMVESGETVMIESGSTCAMLAAELAESRRDITIITNSAFISGHIRSLPGARIILLGGSYEPDAQVMVGPLVRICVREFFVDKFFIGTDGYNEEQGFTNVDMLRAEAVRAMADRARRRIILTDSSKFGKHSVVTLMQAEDVATVITDVVPDTCREYLENNGVEIVIA
jgi:DeoR/GlpR family transcriptional regulator of sugar metabolism